MWRAAERFGQPPEWFDEQPRDKQVKLLMYDNIRQHDEAKELEAMMGVRLKKDIEDAL